MRVARSLLDFILAAARDSYPYEFIGLLAGKKDLAEEVIFLPGTQSGETSATIFMDMLPLGMKVLGTAHSHPSSNIKPSSADLRMFSRQGKYHIIVGYPFNYKNWKCYDRRGNEVDVEVVDTEDDDDQEFWDGLWE